MEERLIQAFIDNHTELVQNQEDPVEFAECRGYETAIIFAIGLFRSISYDELLEIWRKNR